jgi:DNA-binding transcriptional LysR family regulator
VDLRQLEYVTAVARLASFRGAASELYLTESTISLQIKRLERELKVSLFERSQRSVTLTPAGRVLVARAQHVLAEVSAARKEIAELANDDTGRVAFGTTSAAADMFAMLAEFARQHPKIDLAFGQRHNEELIRDLLSGDLDVALTLYYPRTQRFASGIRIEPVYSMQLYLITPNDHPFAQRCTVSIQELRAERLILSPAGSAPNAALEQALDEARVTLATSPVQTTTPGTTLELIAQGLGVGLASVAAATVKGLHAARISDADLTCQGALLSAERGAKTSACQKLLAFARAWPWHQELPQG